MNEGNEYTEPHGWKATRIEAMSIKYGKIPPSASEGLLWCSEVSASALTILRCMAEKQPEMCRTMLLICVSARLQAEMLRTHCFGMIVYMGYLNPHVCSEVSARAMMILRRMAEKQPEMLQTCLAAGLKQTSAFHERIRSNYQASSSASSAGTCLTLSHASCCWLTLCT